MASITLTQSADLAQDELVAGIIENIITVNRMFEVLPFDGIDGNALAYNRENVEGNVAVYDVNDTITAKAAATFTQVTSNLTSIIGDAEVNGLIQQTRSGSGNDQTAVQIASKAKSAGRKYQDMLITGTGLDDEFSGMLKHGDDNAAQVVTASGDGDGSGGDLSFAEMDEMLDLITDKDGQVDYITMNARPLRSYMGLLRALGGASINEVVMLPSGAEVPGYRGVPIFRNDWIPIDQTHGGGTGLTTIIAGTLDDGSRQHGIAGLTAANMAGIQVVDVGESETADNHIWRIKWYSGLALFSVKGFATLKAVNN